MSASPSTDNLNELLLDCRYGDLDSVRHFVETYSIAALAHARDARRNNVLHMSAANGHDDILSYILSLPTLPPSLLTSGNDAGNGNSPLHWACLNAQLACAKLLVAFRPSLPSPNSVGHKTEPPTLGLALGPALILARNDAGQTPLGEAERAGWDEGAQWLVSVMDLQLASASSQEADTAGVEDSDESATGDVGSDADLARLRISDSESRLDDADSPRSS